MKEELLNILKQLQELGECDDPEHLAENFMLNFRMGADPKKTIENLKERLRQAQLDTVDAKNTKDNLVRRN